MKEKKPTLKGNFEFVTTIRDGSQKSLDNAIKETYKQIGGIKKAKTFISKALEEFDKKFSYPAGMNKTIFDKIVAFGKEKMSADNFSDGIPSAVNAANEWFATKKVSESPAETTTSESTETSDVDASQRTTEEPTKKEEPKKETPKKDAPKKETSKKDEPKKETPKKEEPKKETPAENTPTNKAGESSDTSDDVKDEDEKKTSKKSSGFGKAAFCLILAFLVGIGATLGAFKLGLFGTSTTSHNNIPLTADSVRIYEGSFYVGTDVEKTYFKAYVNDEREQGYNMYLLLTKVTVTTEDGANYLKYTGSTEDVYIEIITPLYTEGAGAITHYHSHAQSVYRRDKTFSQINFMFTENNGIISLLSEEAQSQSFTLPTTNK